MTLYLKCGRNGAVFIEMNKNLGATPYFLLEHYKNEKVLHLPFTQIIITPSTHEQGVTTSNAKRTKQNPDTIAAPSSN